MQLTSFQNPQIRDANDNIIQDGAYGKYTALTNAQNTGVLDYINNDLMYLYNNRGYTQTEADNRYLKLSGGTLSGNFNIVDNVPTMYFKANGIRSDIYFQDNTTNSNYACIRCEVNGALQIGRKSDGGVNWYNGAGFTLTKDGMFTLTASNGSGGITLRGNPNGALTWNGKEVITSAGGTMTGAIIHTGNVIKSNLNTSEISIFGGSGANSAYGSKLYLYGGERTDGNKGVFLLQAGDSSGYKQLYGKPNGDLTWGGKNIALSDTFNSGYTTINTSAEVSVANNIVTNLLSFTLTKGVWLVDCVASFGSNANGYRAMGLGTSATNQNEDRHKLLRVAPISSGNTSIKMMTFVNVTTTSKTVYLNVSQTSGSALNVSGGYNLIKLV